MPQDFIMVKRLMKSSPLLRKIMNASSHKVLKLWAWGEMGKLSKLLHKIKASKLHVGMG